MIFIGKNKLLKKRKKKNLTVINISKPKENAPRHHITNFHQNKVEKDLREAKRKRIHHEEKIIKEINTNVKNKEYWRKDNETKNIVKDFLNY